MTSVEIFMLVVVAVKLLIQTVAKKTHNFQ